MVNVIRGRRGGMAAILSIALGFGGCGGADGSGDESSTGDASGTGETGETGGTDEPIDPIDPGEEAPPVNEVGEAGPLRRLDLRMSDGVVELAAASSLLIEAGGRPAPAFGSTHVVLSYAGDELREAVLVSFPTGIHTELHTLDGSATRTIEAVDESMTAVFLRADADVDRIEVRDTGGALALSLTGDELPGVAPLRANYPFPSLPHVAVWTKSDASRLPKAMNTRYGDKIAGASAKILAITEAALQAAPPLARKAVATVVYYSDPFDDKNAFVQVALLGNTMFVNIAAAEALLPNEGYEDLPATRNLMSTLIHESVHCAQSLLNSAGNGADLWDASVKTQARALLEQYYVDPSVGITDTWDAIHEAAVDAGRASEYTASFAGLQHDVIIKGGFMSARGAEESFEDMAEYVAEATLPACLNAANCEGTRRDHACQAMAAAKVVEPFPVEFAIHYVKLALLRRLTLLSPAHFDRCVGPVGLKIPRAGIELSASANFTDGLKAYVYESGVVGWDMLAVYGRGGDHEILIEAPASEGAASALGVHRIGRSYFSEAAGLYIQNPTGELTESRKAEDGLVFFEEISSTRVRGAVFFMKLDGPFGPTERSDFVPILIGAP